MLRIRKLLKEKGLTIADVAERIGVTQSSLSQSLAGNPTLERLKEVADILNVPITDLFEQPVSTIICPKCGTKLKITEDK
ncbi:MAG: helix-turn-helix domain-containing protein [Prevotella sp.]|jgi:transcriptional regulator with XRE-family HTH domain|nr:helix-turn-helix domain-containing protein [Prevotella sp.]